MKAIPTEKLILGAAVHDYPHSGIPDLLPSDNPRRILDSQRYPLVYYKQRDNRGNVQEGAGQSDKCARYYMRSQQQLLDDWIFVLVAGLVVLCICVGERGACVFDVCACPVR